MGNVIQINQLQKSYGNHQVLKGIDLHIEAGQVIGYIGPNGAGKSTTVKILIGLDAQFEGEVLVKGVNIKDDPLAVKKTIGYIPENADLYEVLTPIEFLKLIGRLHGLTDQLIESRARQMLNFLGLTELNERMDTFSKGMRQKVLLVSGLLHDPEIIFLDEPLSGLDANSVILVKEIIARLAKEGKTIFYCSHMMDVVEKVSDRIVLINDGNIVADGTFEELKRQGGGSLEQIFSTLTGKTEQAASAEEFMSVFKSDEEE
ncbi:MAG: ABC transporter ATP-binding protein [Bacteroidota bacterium]